MHQKEVGLNPVTYTRHVCFVHYKMCVRIVAISVDIRIEELWACSVHFMWLVLETVGCFDIYIYQVVLDQSTPVCPPGIRAATDRARGCLVSPRHVYIHMIPCWRGEFFRPEWLWVFFSPRRALFRCICFDGKRSARPLKGFRDYSSFLFRYNMQLYELFFPAIFLQKWFLRAVFTTAT